MVYRGSYRNVQGPIGPFGALHKAMYGHLKSCIRLHRALESATEGYIGPSKGLYNAIMLQSAFNIAT